MVKIRQNFLAVLPTLSLKCAKSENLGSDMMCFETFVFLKFAIFDGLTFFI